MLVLEINFGEIYFDCCIWSNLMVSEIRTHQFCLTFYLLKYVCIITLVMFYYKVLTAIMKID